MTAALAGASLLLGAVYTSYGWLTIIDLARGWRTRGLSHFGLAWIAMAFTCGPHHFEHGLHLVTGDRAGGGLELAAVVVGLPAGVIWFLLRLEALAGGRGDRPITGTPSWVRLLPALAVGWVVLFVAGAATVVAAGPRRFPPAAAPNIELVFLYLLIGWYLLRTQLANHRRTGGWSLSGLSLTVVFPTCALMHGAWVVYQVSGRYELDAHGLTIDWLGVPAAFYFLWVVRSLYLGTMRDWNQATTGVTVVPEPA